MTLTVHVSYDADHIITLTSEHDSFCYPFRFGDKIYTFDDYAGVTCDGVELELTGLPDKNNMARWMFVDFDGYEFLLEEPIADEYFYGEVSDAQTNHLA